MINRRDTATAVPIVLAVMAIMWAGVGHAADKPIVVATFSVLADMVANVGGDHVELATIVGPDGDTELYEPTLADSRTVARARIVFMNDLNDEFEPWLEPLLKQARFGGTKVVVSRGAKTLTGEQEHAISGKELAPAIDQHAWMDPKNGVVYVKNVAEALARADPVNAADYRARAVSYIKDLQAVDAWASTEMAAVPTTKRRIISSHDAFEYLAKAYRITLISIYGWTNKREPSAAEVSRLARQVEEEHMRALFLDSITDPRVMERVATETGAASAALSMAARSPSQAARPIPISACFAMTSPHSRPGC
jgi:zinc/manganese transport system substrate-binding protein